MITAGCEPSAGVMNAASHVPSSVVIRTFFSTVDCWAARSPPAAAASPAAIVMATKSLRVTSSLCMVSAPFEMLAGGIALLRSLRFGHGFETNVDGSTRPGLRYWKQVNHNSGFREWRRCFLDGHWQLFNPVASDGIVVQRGTFLMSGKFVVRTVFQLCAGRSA